MKQHAISKRQQEKLGWIGGWLGGFIWVLILAIGFLGEGKWIQGTSGLLIVGAACATVSLLTPWRFPKAPYRALMIPVYVLFFGAVAWGVLTLGGIQAMGFSGWQSLLIVLPILLPLWIVGNRRWSDNDT